MIRSSKHTLRYANTGKIERLDDLIREYRIAVQQCIDFIWSHQFEQNDRIFNIQTDQLDLPLYLDYKLIPYEGFLAARCFCSAFEQAIDMVRAATQKRKQTLFVKQKLLSEHKAVGKIQNLLDGKYRLVKPSAKNIRMELSSKCVDFEMRETKDRHFDLFIRLHALGTDNILLPVKLTKPFNSRKNWKLLTGVSISTKNITLRQETETPALRTEGEVAGADKGMTTVLSLSDGQQTQPDNHGHTFASIAKTMARKKKGSKAFERAQLHRLNHINWSINQLNFSGIKQLNMEMNSFRGEKRSRFLSHNAFSIIDQKIKNLSEELGVRVKPKACACKSQRCSSCHWVHKKNRKGKEFHCVECDFSCDSDVNAAINNADETLQPVPKWAVSNHLNRKDGFFWEPSGLFDRLGREIRVPDPEEG